MFIAAHADQDVGGLRWGVEPICRVLSEHGCPIAPLTYYAARAATSRPSQRQLRDSELKVEIRGCTHRTTASTAPARSGFSSTGRASAVARCTVERLMSELGLVGARRGSRVRTTVADAAAVRPADLVERNFNPPAPNRTWVADFT